MKMSKKVAIIGAGASGLPAIKICVEYGFEPVCYEKTDDIGGLWRFRQSVDDTEGCVMKSTVINTSKEMTAYSDFPPDTYTANFMHNTEMLNYFRNYAKAFNLRQYIQFETNVLNVRRADDYVKSGKWIVETHDKSGVFSEQTFDGVLCCTGHHVTPYSATFEGEKLFTGRVLHSHSYRDTKGFEDKKVVVVGLGNSGGDAAVDLSRIASHVYLVSRRGTWVVNRIWTKGVPIDIANTNRFTSWLRLSVPTLAEKFTKFMLNQRFDHGAYGLQPDHGPFGAHVTVNDELPNRIACGTVRIMPQIGRFVGERSIEFVDGSRLDNVDVVLKCTGYSFHFPALEHGKLIPVNDNQVSLYQFMYDPNLAHPETLAIIGLIQPLGSIMPISEMQCRVFCSMLIGHTKLPTNEQMRAHINTTMQRMQQIFVASRRHTIQVDYSPFMDELASLIGCRPNWRDYLWTDPALARQLCFGPQAAYHYRLVGPHAWQGARSTILTLQDRVAGATRVGKGKGGKVRSNDTFDTYSIVLLLIVITLVLYLFW